MPRQPPNISKRRFRTSDGSWTPSLTLMTTFGLVHGAWHGAWCWERLTPLLQQAGHDAVVMDLPIDDNAASFDTWADVVCAAIDGCGDDLVLVGHSYGGHTLPLVAARRSVRHLVYLCAFLPEIGRSFADQLRDEPEQLNPAIFKGLEFDGQSRAVWADVGLAQALMYADCDESTAQAAIKRLRPQAAGGFALPFSLAEFPSVACTYIICSEDRIIGGEWSRRIARDRLGADLMELPGSHSPFLSRPSALADVLLHLAET